MISKKTKIWTKLGISLGLLILSGVLGIVGGFDTFMSGLIFIVSAVVVGFFAGMIWDLIDGKVDSLVLHGLNGVGIALLLITVQALLKLVGLFGG